jgi:hypothetical protein
MYAVNLNLNETDAGIRSTVEKHKLSMPVAFDRNGTLASLFQIKGTPFHALIDRNGQVVYTTYHDDATLAQKMEQLAKQSTIEGSSVTEANIETNVAPSTIKSPLEPLPAGLSLAYFSATWCDTYLPDMQPETANSCKNANSVVDGLIQRKSATPLQAYVTHLWTTEQDLKDYVARQKITYPVVIDQNSAHFNQYQGIRYPVIIAFRDGKEIRRFEDFDKPEQVQAEIAKLIQ